MKRPPLSNNEIYHVVLRGVGGSLIFQEKEDYYRGIFSLFEFNDTQPVVIRERRRKRLHEKEIGHEQFSAKRKTMVEILAFCFMPNHIHLLLRQVRDAGITDFMRKFGTGFASYFNKKHNRKGHLFQSKFGAVHIKNNRQLRMIFIYIHTNPLSLIEPSWKERGTRFLKKAIAFLDNYKWSSYQDYLGKNNFPSVTERDFFLQIMNRSRGCRSVVNDWIKNKGKITGLNETFLK